MKPNRFQKFAKRNWKKITSLSLSLVLLVTFSMTGNPVVVKAGLPIAITPNGKLVSWRSTIRYSTDQGALGSLSNQQATSLVNEIFGLWSSVPTASLSVQSQGQITQDVTAANYLNFIRNRNDGVNPIIFDSDGSIIDAIYGQGAHRSTLGYGSPSWMVSSFDEAVDGSINDAEAVLNGAFIGGRPASDTPQISVEQFKTTFVHELGHFLGLGHSQVNIGAAFDRNSANDSQVSIMFPFSVGNQQAVLTQDDKSQITRLYPNAAAAALNGTIRGRILLSDGVTPFQGANVIARRIDDPNTFAIASVSGYRYRGTGSQATFGSTDPAFQGVYEISGLPPGNYTVEVEQIYEEFVGGSGVGPFDPPVDLPGIAEYYSGVSESGSDGPGATIISLNGGQTVDNIDIILNSNTSVTQIGEAEPNNAFGQSQSLTLPSIVTGNAAGTDAGGVTTPFGSQVQDVYSFNASAGDWVTLELDWANPAVNLDLYLYDGSGARLSSSYTCSFGPACGGSFTPTHEQIGAYQIQSAGLYYVGVSSRTSTNVNYSLQVSSQRVNLQNNPTAVTTVSAASYQTQLTPESISAAFGTQLSATTQAATTVPLPTNLGGVTVTVNDHPAGLFFVSPTQVNYEIPAGTAAGAANVTVTAANGVISRGTVTVGSVAPSLFTADASGTGFPAAYVLRVKPNGQQLYEAVARYDTAQAKFVSVPIVAGNGDTVFLVLFGSGLRNAPSPDGAANGVAESVNVTVGGRQAAITYAGAVSGFVGLDQINVQLPSGIVAGDDVPVVVKVSNGQTLLQANAVKVGVQ